MPFAPMTRFVVSLDLYLELSVSVSSLSLYLSLIHNLSHTPATNTHILSSGQYHSPRARMHILSVRSPQMYICPSLSKIYAGPSRSVCCLIRNVTLFLFSSLMAFRHCFVCYLTFSKTLELSHTLAHTSISIVTWRAFLWILVLSISLSAFFA